MTELFIKTFPKVIPKNKQADFKKRIDNLCLNPYVGKPLGTRFMREIKLDKFRVYFVIFEDKVVVYLAAVSDKKNQQKTILLMREMLPILSESVKNINKE